MASGRIECVTGPRICLRPECYICTAAVYLPAGASILTCIAMLRHQQVQATITTAVSVRPRVILQLMVSGLRMHRYRVTVIPTRLYEDQYRAVNVTVVSREHAGQLPAKVENKTPCFKANQHIFCVSFVTIKKLQTIVHSGV